VIVYEVNLVVRETIRADFRTWLAAHVEEILALPGFVAAEILEQREPAAAEGTHALTVQYRLVDEAALARYFAEHAPRLREDGLRRFGDGFSATRRVLAVSAAR
jgi:quinol monooxygenase YgiN